MKWHKANMGNDHQGLVIDEETGANIAVTYDVKHAALVAAAPEMLEALKGMLRLHDENGRFEPFHHKEPLRKAREAIAKAIGGQD